jgi:hypothetical protein
LELLPPFVVNAEPATIGEHLFAATVALSNTKSVTLLSTAAAARRITCC